MLAAPESTEDLYSARGEEVVAARPVMTGDVFTSVPMDVDDHDGLVMVVGHPCAIRRGARLLPRVQVAPIRLHTAIPLHRWPHGHYGVFPLLALTAEDDQDARAANMMEASVVRSAELTRDRRILTMTSYGTQVLLQRLVYAMTRVEVGLEKVEEQIAPVLLEAELEEEWVDELTDDDADDSTMTATSIDFARYMDEDNRRLRVALNDPTRRSDAFRSVRDEIRRRRDLIIAS